MGRRKKRKRVQGKRSARSHASVGFDYGLLPPAAVLSSMTFPNHLGEANIIAVAYGPQHSAALSATVPAITLVGTKADPMRRAFQEFGAWASTSDGDALELTFVFLSTGGYAVTISPEKDRLEQRCLGFRRVLPVISMFAAWVKQMDTIHPMLRQIRAYCQSNFPAPFLVSAAWIPHHIGSAAPGPDAIKSIDDIEPILKFDVSFVDEADATLGSAAAMALEIMRKRKKAGLPRRKSPYRRSTSEVFATRQRSLRTHFPVTLERLKASSDAQNTFARLANAGVRAWQLEQAACNMVLARDLFSTPELPALRAGELERRILEALDLRFEVADLKPLPAIGTTQLEAQLLADARVLLKERGIRTTPSSLADAQQLLASHSLLDLQGAATDGAA